MLFRSSGRTGVAPGVQIGKKSSQAVSRQRQFDPGSPLESAKGVRLRGPVEIAQRPRIAVQVVLGSLVIRQGGRDRFSQGIWRGFSDPAACCWIGLAPHWQEVQWGRGRFGVRQRCILTNVQREPREQRT